MTRKPEQRFLDYFKFSFWQSENDRRLRQLRKPHKNRQTAIRKLIEKIKKGMPKNMILIELEKLERKDDL